MIQSAAAKLASLKGDFGNSRSANAPATWYLAIFVDNTMAQELTGTAGVPRVAIPNDNTDWTFLVFQVTNALQIVSAASSGTWAYAGAFACLMDALTGGNAWDGWNLQQAAVIQSVGSDFAIAAGGIVIG